MKKKKQTLLQRVTEPILKMNLITFVILFMLIFITTSIFKISLNNEITELNSKFEKYCQVQSRVEYNISQARSKISDLSRPDRIRNIAKRKLNMTDPKPSTNIVTLY